MGGLASLGIVAVIFALAASRLERFSIGGPLVFTAAGIVLGPACFSVIDELASGEVVQLVTELTLAMLLFADASTIGLGHLRHKAGVPLRLLAIGLPTTILLGGVLAHVLLPGSSWAVAFLVATILAPTDAALSVAVVSDPRVPRDIRTSLNVESGLNDGIATPVVTVLIAVVAAEEAAAEGWALEATAELAIAVLVAVVLSGAVGWLVVRARRAGWTTPMSDQLLVLATAVLSFTGADALGGNGFVASFVGGLVFGAVSRHELSDATEYTETTGLFVSYVVWGLFGAVLIGPLLVDAWDAQALAYAALSLTIVRMVPVALSLLGVGLDKASVLFVGWFGPRGLASIVFLILAGHELALDSSNRADAPYQMVVWTIALSVVLHGLTAAPFTKAYQARANARSDSTRTSDDDAPAGAPGPRRRRLSLSDTKPGAP